MGIKYCPNLRDVTNRRLLIAKWIVVFVVVFCSNCYSKTQSYSPTHSHQNKSFMNVDKVHIHAKPSCGLTTLNRSSCDVSTRCLTSFSNPVHVFMQIPNEKFVILSFVATHKMTGRNIWIMLISMKTAESKSTATSFRFNSISVLYLSVNSIKGIFKGSFILFRCFKIITRG